MQARRSEQRPHERNAVGRIDRTCGKTPPHPRRTQAPGARPQPRKAAARRLRARRAGRNAAPIRPAQPFPQHYPQQTHRSSARSMATAFTALLLVAATSAGLVLPVYIQGKHPVADVAGKTIRDRRQAHRNPSGSASGTVPTLCSNRSRLGERPPPKARKAAAAPPAWQWCMQRSRARPTRIQPPWRRWQRRRLRGPDGDRMAVHDGGSSGINATEVPCRRAEHSQEIAAGAPSACSGARR